MPHYTLFDPAGSGSIPEEHHISFAVRKQREYFEAQPSERQQETLERVNRLVVQYPQSWLARHWWQIYGERSL